MTMKHDEQILSERLMARAQRLREIGVELGLERLGDTIVADTARRLGDAHVRAAVVGEIKQGKSTLINAIVGEEVLPTGVTPTTGAIVMVRTGATTGPFLDRGDQGRESLQPTRFKQLAKGPLAGSQSDDLDEGSLEYVVAEGRLPPSLELVDTPGINDIAKFRASISRGELPRADILILVLDATQLLNRTELAFLRDAIAAVGGLGDSGARLLLAVNRIDLIAERERPKLLEYLEAELQTIAGSIPGAPAYEVFLTDARTASRDPDDISAGAKGVRDLRARLVELAEGRAAVLPLRARASLLRHATLLGHNAAIASRAVTMEADALKKELRHVERELEEHELDMTTLRAQMSVQRDELLEQSAERLATFATSLQSSVDETLRTMSLRTLSGSFPGAMHDAYLEFARGESERLRGALDQITRKAILTHSEQARRRLFHATMRLGFRGPTIYVDPPSVVLEASLVAVGLAGTAVLYLGNMVAGLLMTIAGPLTTLFLREKSLRNARARAKEELPGAIDDANEGFREQVRGVVDNHLAALDEHLLLANIALGEQLKGVLTGAQKRLAKLETEASATAQPKAANGPTTGASPDPARRAVSNDLHALEREIARIRSELQGVAATSHDPATVS